MRIKSIFSGIILLILLAAVSSGTAADKVKFGTSVKENPYYGLPVVAAQEMGFVKQQGLEMEWFAFKGGAELHRAVAAGSVEMGMSGAMSLIPAIAAGVPSVIVADAQSVDEFFAYVASKSPLKEARDLKGKKVGITRLGGTTHGYGRAVAKVLGIEKEIRFVAAGGVPEMVAAIKAGALDAFLTSYFTVAPLKAKGDIREVVVVRDYLPKEWTDLVLFSRRDFLEKSPEVVKRTVKAMIQGGRSISKERQWAIDKMKALYGFSEEDARASFLGLQYGQGGPVDPRALENVRNFLIEYGIITKEKTPAVERLYVPGFVD